MLQFLKQSIVYHSNKRCVGCFNILHYSSNTKPPDNVIPSPTDEVEYQHRPGLPRIYGGTKKSIVPAIRQFLPAEKKRRKWNWERHQMMLDSTAHAVAEAGELNYNVQDTIIRQADVLIIGGGAIGLAAAFWIKHFNPRMLTVTVLEEDESYTRSSSTLSLGCVTQQWHTPEHILAARFSADFFRNAPDFLGMHVEDPHPPDIEFEPHGCLTLINDDQEEQTLERLELQRKLGLKLEFLGPEEIKAKWPWLSLQGVKAGVWGLQDEGWLTPWKYLRALKKKCVSIGVRCVEGRLSALDIPTDAASRFTQENISMRNKAYVVMPDDTILDIDYAQALVTAGHRCRDVASLTGIHNLNIGDGSGNTLDLSLPITERLRYVWCVLCEAGPGLDTPFILDQTTGLRVRRDGLGGHYLISYEPPREDEPDTLLQHVPPPYYEHIIHPLLKLRLPALAESGKLVKAWAHYIDENTADGDFLIGPHPIHKNMSVACGFKGYGLQLSPAIGRALMENVYYGDTYRAIDFHKFGFERISSHADMQKMLDAQHMPVDVPISARKLYVRQLAEEREAKLGDEKT